MPAAQYMVADNTPIRIDHSGECLVANQSAVNTVYLTEWRDNNGFPLYPGDTMSWDAAKDLYVYALNGNSPAQIAVVDNGGTYTSARAVASQILSQGLASQIANSISLTGAPPINTFDLVYTSDTVAVGAGADGQTPTLHVAKYQSLVIKVWETTGAVTPSPLPRSTLLEWLEGAAVGFMVDVFFTTTTNNTPLQGITTYTIYVVPVRTPDFWLTFNANGVAANMSVRVYGRTNTTDSARYQHISGHGPSPAASVEFGQPGDGYIFTQWASKAGGTPYNTYPSVNGGRCFVTAEATGVTTGGNFYIFDQKTGAVLSTFVFAVNAGTQTFTTEILIGTRILATSWAASIVTTGAIRQTLDMALF